MFWIGFYIDKKKKIVITVKWLVRKKKRGSRTVDTGGVIFGKHTGGVVQWWCPAQPLDLLCLGPDDVSGGSVVVRNQLQTHNKPMN